MEREKGRERERTSCEYERESCHKMVVQISFLLEIRVACIKIRGKKVHGVTLDIIYYFNNLILK